MYGMDPSMDSSIARHFTETVEVDIVDASTSADMVTDMLVVVMGTNNSLSSGSVSRTLNPDDEVVDDATVVVEILVTTVEGAGISSGA
jgi:hypothetical protein